MYTIIMNPDKSLTTTVRQTIYQREKNADKIQFLLPQKYEPSDINIMECTILLKYTDQGNVAHTKKLIAESELYKDKVRCLFDIDSDITRFAGDIIVSLSFLKLNEKNGLNEEVLHSGECVITVLPLKNLYSFVADESLQFIDKTMLELEAKAKALEIMADSYDKNKADNLSYKNKKLQLTSKGELIGDPVEISNGDGSTSGDDSSFEMVEF